MTSCQSPGSAWVIHRRRLAEPNDLNKTAVFGAFAVAGITAVTVACDGEGDSGRSLHKIADALIPDAHRRGKWKIVPGDPPEKRLIDDALAVPREAADAPRADFLSLIAHLRGRHR